MTRITWSALAFLVAVGCGDGGSTDGGSDDAGPSDDACRAIGNQPPCCEFFGHRETPDGRCEEGLELDAGTHDAGPPTCETNDECPSTGPEILRCCPGGVCDLGPCISGPAPPPACEDRDPSDACGDELVCVNDPGCGSGFCERDCRVDGDCAARGLTCSGDVCTFDCNLAGFAGCPAGQVCRENGHCGAPTCDTAGCGPAEDCTSVPTSPRSHRDDGCRPKPCGTSAACPSGTFCINGGCAEQPGMCGDATPPA